MTRTVIKVVVVAAHIIVIALLYMLSGSDDSDAGSTTDKPVDSGNKPATMVQPSNGNSNNSSSASAGRPATATQPRYQHYVVKRGDNLSVIAKKHNTTINQIKKLNNLKDNKIFPGQKLVVSE